MYVCMHVCMYVCNVCMHVRMYVSRSIYVRDFKDNACLSSVFSIIKCFDAFLQMGPPLRRSSLPTPCWPPSAGGKRAAQQPAPAVQGAPCGQTVTATGGPPAVWHALCAWLTPWAPEQRQRVLLGRLGALRPMFCWQHLMGLKNLRCQHQQEKPMVWELGGP